MNYSDVAIKVENMSKCYRIGLKGEIHNTFGSAVLEFIKSPLKNYRKYRSLYNFNEISSTDMQNSEVSFPDIIWALRNVSFQMPQGEVLGIIGKNGAGKSTLLKILSRITDPTNGCAEIHGRVSSLLEVGTGFHQELTGRENIYLNGTVLGMTKKEIARKFDEIVEFSGVGKFIDTPVKRYSSGMKVRLAFSVAAHLEPEILLIDEVLAVGDTEFQEKCLGKMEAVSQEGRTILFVSHNMGPIANLCRRVLWLENGQIKLDGPAPEVVRAYLSSGSTHSAAWTNPSTFDLGEKAHIKHVRVLNPENNETTLVDFDKHFTIEITYEVFEGIRSLSVLSRLTNSQGYTVWTSWDTDNSNCIEHLKKPGNYVSVCTTPGKLLKPGQYRLSVGFVIDRRIHLARHENVITFEISVVGYPLNLNRQGIITPLLKWTTKKIN